MIVLDTSAVFAAIDSKQRMHQPCAEALAKTRPPLLLSPFVLAELDYLVTTRVGATARMSLLGEVERGAYDLQPFTASDIRNATAVIERHADLGISLADASLVVLAARHNTHEVLTLDERHFRVLSANRKPFRLLPADG